ARLEDIAMDQVVGRVANEGVALVRLGKQAAVINHRAARGSDVAAGHQLRGGEVARVKASFAFLAAARALHAPRLKWADAEHLAGGIMIGNVQGDLTDR